jgi:hypothetical protein
MGGQITQSEWNDILRDLSDLHLQRLKFLDQAQMVGEQTGQRVQVGLNLVRKEIGLIENANPPQEPHEKDFPPRDEAESISSIVADRLVGNRPIR